MTKCVRPLVFATLLLGVTGCSSYFGQLADATPLMRAQSALEVTKTDKATRGQLDVTLPEFSSKRALVNNRRAFNAYQGQGELLLNLNSATTVRLQINGKTLTLMPDAAMGQHIALDISRYTRNGVNQLALLAVEPLGAQVRIIVPFARLTAGSPEQVGMSSAKLAEVDALINHDVAQGFPGAVLVVVKDGRVIKQTAYGYASRYASDGSALAEPEPMRTDTLFDLASNTKMYATNYAIMHMVSTGQLDINLPIHHYLPEYQGDGRESRLVRDLLNHNAGYAPEVHFFNPLNKNGPEFYSIDRQHTIELLTQKVPFERERGGKAIYSDIDYMLLGLIIERINGMPQDQYLEQTLYRPMGLQHTLFNPLRKGIKATDVAATELDGNSRGGRVSFPANQQGVIRGNVHDEKARYSLDGVAGHAGLFSTGHDTAELAFMALQGGYGLTEVFDQSVIQQFVRPAVSDHTVGLGWRTAVGGDLNWHFGPYASAYAFGHTGWTGTATLIDPMQGLIVVLLTNKKHSPVLPEGENGYYFAGDRFETGMYGSIMSKIYEAIN